MASIAKDSTLFDEFNLDLNKIGNDGCVFLSRANWQNLTMLFLSNNKIGVEGMKHLCKAQWP